MALLEDKEEALNGKDETIKHISLELMAATEREEELRGRLQEIQKRYSRLNRFKEEMEKEGSDLEQMLEKLINREEQITVLTQKYNKLEKALELERKKVKELTFKLEKNPYMEINVSDEKYMEEIGKEKSFAEE